MNYQLLIQHGEYLYAPVIKDGVSWTTERKCAPSTMRFTVINDKEVSFTEGDPVRLEIGKSKVFYGFIFTKKRNKDGHIEVTAYDQLRYLKNKDTYTYENKTAAQVVKMIARDFQLNTGTIQDTYYRIPSRVEDNSTLFDIIQNALDLELQNNGNMYVLYDSFGRLTLKSVDDMRTELLIDAEVAEDFDYQSSIDGNTYNQIKLIRSDANAGKSEVFITKSTANINKWGVLQYFEKINSGENGKTKADGLLKLYNTKTRSLKIKNAFGDPSARAGSLVIVKLNLGDVKLQNYMLIEKAVHNLTEGEYFMDLTLRGGVINE